MNQNDKFTPSLDKEEQMDAVLSSVQKINQTATQMLTEVKEHSR
jgi:hypothetical protein